MLKPLNNKILLGIEEVKIGAIQSDAVEEWGVIEAIGKDVDPSVYTIGAKLYFKAWAVDVITIGSDKYYFISHDSDAICAISTIE